MSTVASVPSLPILETARPILTVPGLPIAGNIVPMSTDPLPFFVDCYERYGPVFRIRVFNQSWVVLAGTEANTFLGREGHRYLTTREVNYGFLDALGTDSILIATDGARHAELRRIQKRAHGKQALPRHVGTFAELTKTTIDELPLGKPFDPVPHFKRLATRQLGVALTRADPLPVFDDIEYLLKVIANVTQLKKWPGFLLKMPKYRRARERVRALALQVKEEHLRKPSPESEADLIDDLIAFRDEDDAPLTDDVFISATFGAFAGGLNTVANVLAFALFAMLKHPATLDSVREEVNASFKNGPLTLGRLQKMSRLRGMVMETMRMYPPIITLLRHASKTFEFDGCTIEAGEQVFFPTVVPHFLNELYPNAKDFDIERFGTKRQEHKQPGAYGSFGMGAHHCLGAGLSEVMMMTTLATWIHSAEFELHPQNFEMKKIRLTPLRDPDPRFRVKRIR